MSSVTNAEANKALVLEVLNGVFVQRDASFVDRYFDPAYRQHNPAIPNGHEAIKGLLPMLNAELKYERGMAIAEGDLVMVHGRYTGWGPKPMVAVDIFRVLNGKLVEHWDVMQEEVPAAQTQNGNGMFP